MERVKITAFENVFLATSDVERQEGFLRGYDAAFLARVMTELHMIMGNAFDNFIYVIDAPSFRESRLKPSLAGKVPILFYGGDEKNDFDDSQTSEYALVFRAYMTRPPTRRLHPMPLGTTPLLERNMVKKVDERKTNVFFSGCLNANRVGLYSYLRFGKEFQGKSFWVSRIVSRILREFWQKDLSSLFENSYVRFTDGFQKGLSQASYAEKICDSRIVLCPCGFISPETIRHYEALQAGCTVITKKSPFNDLLARAPMTVIDSWQELRTMIPFLLSSPDILEDNRQRALKWWELHASPRGFASYVAERIGKLVSRVS